MSDPFRSYESLTEEQRALLEVIEEFKRKEQSPLAAALNVITNHAAEIRRLSDNSTYEVWLDSAFGRTPKQFSTKMEAETYARLMKKSGFPVGVVEIVRVNRTVEEFLPTESK